MRYTHNDKMGCGVVVVAFLFIAIIIGGPAGIKNKWAAWRASAYGSDWLVVQYTQDGSIIKSWELKNSAIHSESQSDGIYFTTEHGVVHLSGHYIYVQNPTDEMRDDLVTHHPRIRQRSRE